LYTPEKISAANRGQFVFLIARTRLFCSLLARILWNVLHLSGSPGTSETSTREKRKLVGFVTGQTN